MEQRNTKHENPQLYESFHATTQRTIEIDLNIIDLPFFPSQEIPNRAKHKQNVLRQEHFPLSFLKNNLHFLVVSEDESLFGGKVLEFHGYWRQ